MTKHTLLYILLFIGITFQSKSQVNVTDSSINMPLLKIGYSGNFSGGDLKDRFGYTSFLNFDLSYKLKSQWGFGIKYDYLFGNVVHDTSMLDDLKTTGGGILANSGDYGIFESLARGHQLSVYGSRLFPVLSPNANSGIVVNFGVGLLIHQIKYNNISGDIIQLNGEYSKGYDRYTSGLSLHQYIGYRFLSNNRLLNFYAGFEFTQGFTKIRRDYQVDYSVDDERFGDRKDFMYSFKIGWILPLHKREPREYYY